MKTYSFYRLSDGRFVDKVFGGPLASVADNTPADCAAVEGVFDRDHDFFDIERGEVVHSESKLPSISGVTFEWQVRRERDRRLAACDWIVTRAAERGEKVPEAWASYRQALRDVTKQDGFPNSIVWPAIPA